MGKNQKEMLEKEVQWEKLVVAAAIEALRPSGDVLQVGFRQAASCIQNCHPKTHTIIESDPQAAEAARSWASTHTHVTIIQNTWQNALPSLGAFDAIFFQNPIDHDPAYHRENASLALHREKELFSMIGEKLPQLSAIRYSDSDIEEFYNQVGQHNLKELPRFFAELKSNGQISEEQHDRFIQKYHLKKEEAQPTRVKKHPDHLFPFLQECLKNHMRKGSRLSSFSREAVSKFEDPLFFEHIITNPHLDYQETLIPDGCKNEVLVMVIEKLS